MPSVLSAFSALDTLAVLLLLGAWGGVGWAIENPPAGRPSVSTLMHRYRRDWMSEMITRQPRIFDASILATLRQGTTFLASGAMIAVGGVLALAGNVERLDDAVMGIGVAGQPAAFWQGKLALVALLLTVALFKFIWSNRLFGYCAVVMAAVPNDPQDRHAVPRAAQAAEINIRAAINFNRGLRTLYFAFAALTWLIGPWALMIGTAGTAWVLIAREFTSQSRGLLMED
ncbi:DUF599 domain-containing protein [Jannaschia sp. GRR-S6-38]|uniref:DUF599 domain-containing protein n=2 Tax=Jannaschia ovalis TaxID=3038773 RepID=A0ABY8LJK7_9RHOB|nr:DUF599 domain-containing protein [Jannaschia sp. GRR-S6-38]WGH80323.1 DUF599 domain-containing protein [Jannaschia sp. GRR-S6-38]